MKKLRQLIIIPFLISFTGCLYFDYGVNKESTNLPYRTYYHSEKDKKFDFNTVLYSRERIPQGTYNYIDFVIRISHMYKGIHQNKNKGKYISEIKFSNFTVDVNIHIDPKSIQLIHRNPKGEIIPCIRAEHDLNRELKTKHRNHYYRKIYDPKILSKELTEYIYLEFSIDGRKEIVEYKLPIKKKLHYTWWDVMMSI